MKGGMQMKHTIMKFLADIAVALIQDVIIDYIRSLISNISKKKISKKDKL